MFKVVKDLPNKLKQSKKFLVVFDLDGTLTPLVGKVEQIGEQNDFYQTLDDASLILDIRGLVHCIALGAIELLQMLDRRPDVEIAFFSAGVAWRNELFVEELLCRALGKLRYAQLQPTLKILSRNHLTYLHPDDRGVKDLTLFGHPLENVVMIDDDLNFFKREHVPNVLQVLPNRLTSHLVIHRSHRTAMQPRYTWESFIDEIHYDGHFASVNQMFYAAGLLFKVLDRVVDDTSLTLRKALINLQYRCVKSPDLKKRKWISQHEELSKEPDFYHQGIYFLKGQNSALYFIDDDEFLGQYRAKTMRSPGEVKCLLSYRNLIVTIKTQLSLSLRVKNGFFAGKLPRPLREINEIFIQLDNSPFSLKACHDVLKILRIAQNMCPGHPLMKVAQQCYSAIKSLVVQPARMQVSPSSSC